MFKILALTCLMVVLVGLVIIAIVRFFFSPDVAKSNKKIICSAFGVLFIIFMVFNGLCLALNSIYVTTPEMSAIEIKEIYYDQVSTSNTFVNTYVIRDNNDKLYTIKTDNICKGESNYLIVYTQPKLTPTLSNLIDVDIHEYQLVLTDPEDVAKLSPLYQ